MTPRARRLPCPSSTPRTYSNSCPSRLCCHPTISSSAVPFSSRLQSFPASGYFQTLLVVNDKYLFCHKLLLSQSCLTLCDSRDRSMPGLSDPHHLPEFGAQFPDHSISGATQPSQPLTPSSALDHSLHLLNISV